MSWLYSRVLVEEYLGDNCSDGEPSVPLSGSSTPQAYCALDKMTGFSRISRFGMTFKPLTESRGEELLTLYLEDFRARTSQLQGKEMDLTEKGQDCGKRWQGLLAKLDQDTALWKIPQCSLLEDLEQSLEIWPNWGSMRNGVCWEQMKLVQTTKENESGLWLTPTATAISGRSPKAMEYRTKQRELQGHNTVQPGNLAEQVMYSGKMPCKDMKNPTWPTPTSNMYKGSSAAVIRQDGKNRSWDSLHYAVEQVTDIGGKLNPTWVEWLMGWPLEWTDLKPLETDKSLCVPQQPLNYLKRD